jgi:hypothetical protein
MPSVASESTTPVFERAKTVHALDRGATVMTFPGFTEYKQRLIHLNCPQVRHG